MYKLQLSPPVLDWAAADAGLSLVAIAEKLSRHSVDDILQGRLTEPQAEKFAQIAKIPLGYLFMQEPPRPRQAGVADFRTVVGPAPLSKDFFDVFDDVQYKQDWYRDYLESVGATPLEFVGKFSGSDASVQQIAVDVRQALHLNEADRRHLQSPNDLYALLVERCENIGILVFKNGVVGNNTHRPLSVEEFRGFVLCDSLAPVIFINGADAPAAWVFTLVHELGHIWLGDSGISDAKPNTHNAREAQCNAIAAEVLVPQILFREFWAAQDSRQPLLQIIAAGRLHFRVSELVIARRALDLSLVSRQLYDQVYEQSKRHAQANGGGDFYRTVNVRNSRKFTARVSSLAMSGMVSFREAGRLLNVAPARIATLYQKNHALPA
ncbi:ImmA/IrrE family metallo-endopeptidase [uncultured Castellaniella sp.]|uniref:ImmA/IrrE family metallo-endopeptidase n=1 Tax=uncultured Castellaniella sp. TaxID=647907 RepID=UPI002630EEAD|nr:ImmA/IrrE family metallo-endopeptidase [uncultured Castellaniella sp.]